MKTGTLWSIRRRPGPLAPRFWPVLSGKRTALRATALLAFAFSAFSPAPAAAEAPPSGESLIERLEQASFDDQSFSLIEQFIEEGKSLTEVEARQAEEELERNPRDLVRRLQLIGYHQPGERREVSLPNYFKHVLGIIEHHPTSDLAGSTGMLLVARYFESTDDSGWIKGAAMWRALVAEHPEDPRILANAGSYLRSDLFRESPEAIRLLERAHDLDPENPRVHWLLGTAYAEHMERTYDVPLEERVALAGKALERLSDAKRLSSGAERHWRVAGGPLLQVLAQAAFIAGEFDQAKTFADELLASLDPEEESSNYGNVIHETHTILGRVAMRQEKIPLAAEHLLHSARLPASSQLGYFGPSFQLARELLEQGEREAVVQYLDLVSSFWGAGRPLRYPGDHLGERMAGEQQALLDAWKMTVEEGKIPDHPGWK